MKRRIGGVEKFLLGLGEFIVESGKVFPLPFESKHSWVRRLRRQSGGGYSTYVYSAKKQKLISLQEKNGEKFISLTEKGELQILFSKAHIAYSGVWDRAWRLVMFDIPESSRDKRNQVRYLLKCNGFIKLQASVFISPYPLHADAIDYLKKSKLIGYIRIVRADTIDDDRYLRKRFHLP